MCYICMIIMCNTENTDGVSPDILPAEVVVPTEPDYAVGEIQELDNILEQTGVKPWCEICHKDFSTKGNLDLHKKNVHMKNEGLACALCTKTFGTPEAQKEHSLTHNGPNFRCDECNSTFQHKSSLNRHKLQHASIFKFLCCDCGRGFNHKNLYESHMNDHSGSSHVHCVQSN